MNRRLFLVSLFAPFAARFAPSPQVLSFDGIAIKGLTFNECTFIAHRGFTVAEIARIFRVPLRLLQRVEDEQREALLRSRASQAVGKRGPSLPVTVCPNRPEHEQPANHGRSEHQHFSARQLRRLPHFNS